MTPLPRVNAFTVDVEDYFHVAALSGAIDRDSWDRIPPRVDENTRRLLELLDRHDVRGTFFVLGWVAERSPDIVREISRRGHEVACHGLSHRLVYNQSPQEFRDETVRSKRVLEDLTGSAVRGYRAASYSITKASFWAMDIIVEAGFEYDSSIFPVRHDLYGIPGSSRSPHSLTTESGAEIVEFPPTTVRLLGANVPVGGGGYFRLYPYRLTRQLLRVVNRSQSFMFYVHPWEVDPEQPRVNARLLSRFRHYVNLDKCEAKLDCLMRDFSFGTVHSVLTHLDLLPGRQAA